MADKNNPKLQQKPSRNQADNRSGLVAKVYAMSFDHIYKVNGFMNPTIRRHDCLNSGYWCWQNARQHPLDLIKYLKKKLRAL